jgi:hypothetical protein
MRARYALPGSRSSEKTKPKTELTVATNGLDWAALEGLFTESALVIRLGLLVEVGMTAVVVALEISRCRLTAEIAVDALIVHVVCAFSVLGVFVFSVRHLGVLRGLGRRILMFSPSISNGFCDSEPDLSVSFIKPLSAAEIGV